MRLLSVGRLLGYGRGRLMEVNGRRVSVSTLLCRNFPGLTSDSALVEVSLRMWLMRNFFRTVTQLCYLRLGTFSTIRLLVVSRKGLRDLTVA